MAKHRNFGTYVCRACHMKVEKKSRSGMNRTCACGGLLTKFEPVKERKALQARQEVARLEQAVGR